MILEARDTHIPLVHSPSFYPETHHGKVQKYTTIAEMMRYLPEIVEKDFHSLRLDKPRDKWTKWEKSHHKIAIVVNEMRKFAPSQRLSGDMESSVSKKAWFNYLPESRHYKSFIVGDLQSSADMFVGIRNQDDMRIIKRSTLKLLGTELGWFAIGIDNIRRSKLESWGYNADYPNSIPPMLIEKLNRKYPRVSEIPDNKGYVVYGNGEFKVIQFDTPSWHHKSDRDDFYADTGISWQISEKVTETEKVSKTISNKVTKDDEMKLIHQMKQEGKAFDEIIKHFIEKEKFAGNLETRWNKENNKKLSYRYNYWLKKSRTNSQ